MSNFSERLKELMQEKELTQTALSKETGIRTTLISNFILAKNLPSYENLLRFAYYFNCSVDYLLGKTDFPDEAPLHEVPFFHERLRQILQEQKISQERLKRELPVSGSVLYKWISGKSQPSSESLLALADYFETSVDYLIGRIR